jgi:hypothetical protein
MKDEKRNREGHSGAPATDPKKDPVSDSSKDSSKDSRKDRLKLALRANLKRRKSQARGRGDLASASSNGDAALPYDESRKSQSE